VALVGAAAVLLRRPSAADPALAEGTRRIEMRLAYAPADPHRPFAPRKIPSEKPSAKTLAALERKTDASGFAAALLLRGDPSLVNEALKLLAPLPSSPEVETNRAAALLAQGKPEEALRHLGRALEGQNGLPQALWNRALALKALDLRRIASRDFEAVAARNEPGWSAEARTRGFALLSADKSRRERWQSGVKVGQELATSGALPSAAVLAGRPASLRQFFYDAVRTRTSAEQVRALLPVARELDRTSGGDVLSRHLEAIASRDFARRAPLVRDYERLRGSALPPAGVQALITALLRSGEDDLVLGALERAEAVATHLETFEARSEASGDPWFRLLAAQERARAQMARGEDEGARRTLTDALARCATEKVELRCLHLEQALAELDTRLGRLDDAWTHALGGWRKAGTLGEWAQENVALGQLAKLAKLRNDPALARAYEEELAERTRGAPAPAR
jgi:tetratricopeptide (TPR) repeat protein